jgi:fructoselysine-6-P-deglycase FrlB-like protein
VNIQFRDTLVIVFTDSRLPTFQTQEILITFRHDFGDNVVVIPVVLQTVLFKKILYHFISELICYKSVTLLSEQLT